MSLLSTKLIPYWRNTFKCVTNQFNLSNADTVVDLLCTSNEQFMQGLLLYTPYSEKGDQSFMEKVNTTNKDLERFIIAVAKNINVDAEVAYGLFCNYVMFEHFGKADELVRVSKLQYYTMALSERIYNCYTMDRMFYLKSLKYILESYLQKDHQLNSVYAEFVERNTIKLIKTSILDQLDHSVTEISIKNYKNTIDLPSWLERNLREQKQLLSILMMIIGMDFDITDCFKMLDIFSKHGFAMNPQYYESIPLMKEEEMRSVKNLEHAAYMLATKKYFEDTNWIEHAIPLHKILTGMPYMLEEHSLLILVWCIQLSTLDLTQIDWKYNRFLQVHLDKVFMEDVYSKMVLIMNEPFIKGTVLERPVKECFYVLMEQICERSTDYMHVYKKECMIDVLATLMEIPDIADRILHTSCPLNVLLMTAINMYPHDFRSLTLLCTTLLRVDKKYTPMVVELVSKLECLTRLNVDNFKVGTKKIRKDICHSAFRERIPAGAVATIFVYANECLAQFQGNFTYTYFHYLENHFREALNAIKIIKYNKLVQSHEDKIAKHRECVAIGFDFLCELISRDSSVLNNLDMKSLLHQVKICLREKNNPNRELFYNSVKLFAVLLDVPSETELATDYLTCGNCFKLMPRELYSTDNFKQLDIISECNPLLMMWDEKNMEKYDFLQVYLQILLKDHMTVYYYQRFQVKGMMYLLRHVFPNFLNWKFKSMQQRVSIGHELLKYIFNVLSIPEDLKSIEEFRVTYEFCVESILNSEPFIDAFISLLRMGNPFIESIMVRETYWVSKYACEVHQTVKICLSIVLILFRMDASLKQTRFWKMLYETRPNYPSIVRIIMEYVNNKFDIALPTLACRVLKRFAWESSIPMLACLDIDSYQVQSIFLERIRDPLEDESLKGAIFELIETCVNNQDGLTAAFFSLPSHKIETLPVEGETIVAFMVDFINNIDLSINFLKNDIQQAILELMHTLWMKKKTVLVRKTLVGISFWKNLKKPLYGEYTLPSIVYVKLLEILAAEVTFGKPDDNLAEVIREMFKATSTFPEVLLTQICDTIKRHPFDPDNKKFLFAWKLFLVAIARMDEDLTSDKMKCKLVKLNLIKLIEYFHTPDDLDCIASLLGIHLYLVKRWGAKSYENSDIIDQIGQCFYLLERIYHCFNMLTREMIVTIAITTCEHFKDLFEHSDKVYKFLDAANGMIVKEHQIVQELSKEPERVKYADYFTWTLWVIYSDRLLKFPSCVMSVFYSQVFDRSMTIVGYLFSHTETIPLTVIIFDFLRHYMRTELRQEYYFINFGNFYFSFEPPKHLFDFKACKTTGCYPWQITDFWLAYSAFMTFNFDMMKTFGKFMFTPILEFLFYRKSDIITLVKLPSITVNDVALKLVSNCLKVLTYMFKWEDLVKLRDCKLVINYMLVLSDCFEAAINIIVCPRMLKFYFRNVDRWEMVETVPLEMLVDTMDRIMDIICSNALVLLDLCPSLYENIEKTLNGNVLDEIANHKMLIQVVDDPFYSYDHYSIGEILTVCGSLCKNLVQRRADGAKFFNETKKELGYFTVYYVDGGHTYKYLVSGTFPTAHQIYHRRKYLCEELPKRFINGPRPGGPPNKNEEKPEFKLL